MLHRRVLLTIALFVCPLLLGNAFIPAAEPSPPKVGQEAPELVLQAVSGELEGQVKLEDALKKGPVALIVLRGFPGYQCPICSRQVQSFVAKAEEFKQLGATVLMVYPGPGEQLGKRAQEFIGDTTLPAPFTLLLDPDYTFTNAYGLRWDAPRETAYPSTFVIGSDRKVQFAKVSREHGGRSQVKEVLASLEELKK